jgi:hypothetical protein
LLRKPQAEIAGTEIIENRFDLKFISGPVLSANACLKRSGDSGIVGVAFQ